MTSRRRFKVARNLSSTQARLYSRFASSISSVGPKGVPLEMFEWIASGHAGLSEW